MIILLHFVFIMKSYLCKANVKELLILPLLHSFVPVCSAKSALTRLQ